VAPKTSTSGSSSRPGASKTAAPRSGSLLGASKVAGLGSGSLLGVSRDLASRQGVGKAEVYRSGSPGRSSHTPGRSARIGPSLGLLEEAGLPNPISLLPTAFLRTGWFFKCVAMQERSPLICYLKTAVLMLFLGRSWRGENLELQPIFPHGSLGVGGRGTWGILRRSIGT